MTRLGYQIPNFTYPGVEPAGLFDVVAAQAREADRSGFDTVLVMDHFFQLPMIGAPEEPMLECYTLLAALARETSSVRLGALVTGNTYRNPAVLAKTVTTLDVVSGGRGQLGIGAGWYELEHDAFGIEFGTFTDRFEKLEEALAIVVPMLRGEAPTTSGARYTTNAAVNSPAPVSRIPVMIGGSGERKTLRLVARWADDSNLTAAVGEVPRKLEVLAAHCADVGRPRSEITVTTIRGVCIAPTMEQARADFDAAMARKAPEQRAAGAGILVGDPDTVGEALAAELALGIDGFTLSLTCNGHVPGRVTLLGETAAKVVGP